MSSYFQISSTWTHQENRIVSLQNRNKPTNKETKPRFIWNSLLQTNENSLVRRLYHRDIPINDQSKTHWRKHICYIITEGFFLYYHFSLGLVRLRTIRLSAHEGAHIECSSRSRTEDVTITNVIIKTPERKWDWGVNDVMPGIEGLWFLLIFEKVVSWDLSLSEASWDLNLGEASWFLSLGEASPVGLRDAPRICWVRWNNQHTKNCVSLSPRVERLNSRNQ